MKILAFIPLRYSESGQFWERDLGLIIAALAELGHEAIFVALGDSHPDQKSRPLLLIDYATAADPAWWKKQNPDAIILNTWSAPRHDAIRRAATSAGCPVIEKLDTDGVKSPRIYPIHALRRGFVNYDLRRPLRSGIPRKSEALARFIVTYLFPSLLDKPMVRCMSRVPVYAAETPLSSARVRRFLRMYQADPMPKVVTVPHPVNTLNMGFGEGDSKQNQVIAVGRWDDAVKGWPLLRRIAMLFLRIAPEYRILVAGLGAEVEGHELETMFPGRFLMLGRLGHAELNKHLRASKIYLLTSHSETFNIAGAEALCCGCSVVGPGQIPSVPYFCSKESGTVSHLRNASHMTDALMAEVDEWANGKRNPESISKKWIGEVGAPALARKYLEIIAQIR